MDGHLDPSNTKVLRYIAWNEDHKFLDDQCLEPTEGVTFDLITPKPQGTTQENQPEKTEEQKNEANKENKEPSLEDTIKNLLIEEIYPNMKKGLCAAVYTQLSDVEGEINGLMTYDRKVLKVDKNVIKKTNNLLKVNDSIN